MNSEVFNIDDLSIENREWLDSKAGDIFMSVAEIVDELGLLTCRDFCTRLSMALGDFLRESEGLPK